MSTPRTSLKLLLLVLCLALTAASRIRAESLVVDTGKPNAEIVISADPKRPRMVNLAALELQYYIEKISGARLPIRTEPNQDTPR